MPLAIKAFFVALLFSSISSAAIVEHVFHVEEVVVKPLCQEQMIPSVNGSLPGPTINVREGDTLVVHVINNSTYNITIHWHGVFQLKSSWMDGTNMITQCPIQPSNNYTYRFDITGQEGTLLWHAHVNTLRATLHGALIIRPRSGRPYPFPKPYKEVPVIFEQWWNADIGRLRWPVPTSDGYLINGRAGDSYPCAENRMFRLKVVQGKTYLLRIINAALNTMLFFKISNHNVTIVALDAVYTTPYVTDVLMLTPGQTVDALLTADQPMGLYYMAIRPYVSAHAEPSPVQATRGLIIYEGVNTTSSSSPVMPSMPELNDVSTAHRFSSNITGLAGGPHWTPVPRHVDERMFIAVGLGLEPCPPGTKCPGYLGQRYAGSLNNRSFVYPEAITVQEAYFYNMNGIYTADFPSQPPIKYDYANFIMRSDSDYKMMFPEKGTSAKMLRFNSTVEVVLQNTGIITAESHPMHLHGFNFFVLGYGFGNYDPVRDARKLNLVNPQMRNTVGVPPGGWVVLRFIANNPGAWMFHCHMDAHMQYGIMMAFIVQNGPTPETSLQSPPPNLPQCTRDPAIYESPTTTIDLSY
ncbi:unnamed protein product [Eruca vesicaria subsp. sativa]|uniref:Laccase n=1 Tax=Eruca vesicaria subsp. sativa TaxID=29727 RepID=A0ABC8JXM3_ERUVS|nr:unnamed protein product [Eruca vesicaria subsp. sativa]